LTELVALHNLVAFLWGRSSPKPPSRLITPAAKSAEQGSRAVSSLPAASSGARTCVAATGTGAASFRFADRWRSHPNARPLSALRAGDGAQLPSARRCGANVGGGMNVPQDACRQ
jgi:hypothetical protein